MEYPIKMDDLGVPLLLEIPILVHKGGCLGTLLSGFPGPTAWRNEDLWESSIAPFREKYAKMG